MTIDAALRRDGSLIFVDPEVVSQLERAESSRPVERAYELIRRAILTGELKPGDHLREEPLSAMTGTSRTPVREALRRLVGEGLAIAENRHRFVADFSYEEVVIIFDVRARLESYAAGVAAQKITDEEIRELERLVVEIDRIDPAGGAEAANAFVTLNSEFHSIIVTAARSRQLKLLTAQAVSLPLVLIKQFVWDQSINIRRSNEQHRDIIAALAQRNSEWATTAMAGHILSTKPKPRDVAPGAGR
ncbi:GntR family transcriptional regulator [Aquibium carbonis]|nr:GntR family transcriptional regulator [Aquibium carbonis]